MNASNPLLNITDLPPFDKIQPEHIVPALEQLLADNRATVEATLKAAQASSSPTWQQLITPLEEASDRLSRSWSPVGHLNSVKNSPELREAYQACLPKLSEYATWFNQNPELFNAYQALANNAEELNATQQKMLSNALRDFRLSGVDLPEAKKQRFADLQQRLSELSNQFSNNVLDATQAWSKLITDENQLAGLPETTKASAAAAAQAKGEKGWLFTLDFPSFQPIMTYADNRELRQEVYTAFVTRASDQSANTTFDNAPLMEEILALKAEKAQLLGFESFAHLSVEKKMARSPEEVLAFLNNLATKAYPQAQQEFAELADFAQQQGLHKLEAWDVGYYSEKLRLARYDLSQETLRPWFSADKVTAGLFQVISKLFNVEFKPDASVATWHKDAHYYQVLRNGKQLAGFYLDLFAREGKRGGAWMDVCRDRRLTAADEIQLPVAYLNCNFTPPVGDQPSLLTHNEVTTLFHEFGHGLHHMLTKVDVPDVSGINGVAWDAVELPSQFMENFCWEREGLDLFAKHVETGEPLPQDLFEKMLAAKNFQSAMQMVRQLEFSLFDFRLHLELKQPTAAAIQNLLDEVRKGVSVVPAADFNRFQNGFSHIFAGGYAAGYYSYKWAEVLSADAFSAFEEKGTFNAEVGLHFCQSILEQGGSQDAMDLFIKFRGREPKIDALLRHSGITAA